MAFWRCLETPSRRSRTASVIDCVSVSPDNFANSVASRCVPRYLMFKESELWESWPIAQRYTSFLSNLA